MSAPNSIILLDADRRLDALLDAAQGALERAKWSGTQEAWAAHFDAWEAALGELAHQLKH